MIIVIKRVMNMTMNIKTKFNNSSCNLKGCQGHMKWLIETLGPVILGAKPAEIISYPKFDCGRCEKLQAIDTNFEKTIKVRYRKITQDNGQIKIIFYDPLHLYETLHDRRNRRFLTSLGYPEKGTLEDYLEILASKLRKGECPDEIGVFLGYPLKDVLGFMGHPSLKFTKVQYWRVYGDARISDEKYKKIIETRNEIKCMMNESSLSCVLAGI